MLMFQKHKIYHWTAILMITCILLGSYGNPAIQRAMAAEQWVIARGGSNGVQDSKINKDTIIQTGTHNAADDGDIIYQTKYYYMTMKEYDLSQPFSNSVNVISKALVDMHLGKETIIGDTKTTEYIINKDDFISAVAELGITANDIIKAGVYPVYLNNVFRTMQGDNDRKNYVYGYQEMLEAEDWKPTTQTYLKGYYNYKYNLVASDNFIYEVKVVAVDENEGIIKNYTLTDEQKYAMYHQKNYTFTLPEKEINIAGIGKYIYQGLCKYSYTDRNTNISSGPSYETNTNGTIEIDSMPNATGILTIKFQFDKPEVLYYYKVEAVGPDHKYLRDIFPGLTQTKGGGKVEKSFCTPLTIGGKVYNYQYQWYLTYEDTNGNKITNPVKTGAILQDPMPVAKEGSTAVFSMVYAAGTVTPPPTPLPTPTPKPGSATPTPTPYIPPVVVPSPAAASLDFTSPVNTGRIWADLRGGERFIAPLGVPTTESLYGEVTAKEYLLGYSFVKKVGIEYYVVRVKRDYILNWFTSTPEEFGGGTPTTVTVPIYQDITVPRAYGYWEIVNLECYKLDNAVLNNYALPGGSTTLYPDYSYYSPPSVNVFHSDNIKYHVLPPKEVEEGITLPPIAVPALEDPTVKPGIPVEDFTDFALLQTGMAKVRSDSLTFNGRTVISGATVETNAPDINTSALPQCQSFISDKVLYKPDQIIEATKRNGMYPSNGTITYTALARIDSLRPEKPQYNIDGINEVVIHTPVVCKPSITADNDKYVQLISPTSGCVQLVLDPDQNLSDFTVAISNFGPHSGKQGYFTRDFSRSLRDPAVSYIASLGGLLRNEVRFPFAVYLDVGTDRNMANDKYIKADTWITMGRNSLRFYLPMWTREGVHTVNFRTVAVNGEPYLDMTQTYANTDRIRYVATDTLNVEVSGRIYGLEVYDLTDYPLWEETFRVPDSMEFKKDRPGYPDGTASTNYSSGNSYTYTLGTNDQYGNDTGRNIKYTFPLVNGSHPQYKNIGILKTGYMVRFSLETTGSMFSDACQVMIRPNFYFVDKDGRNRTAVDLYYTEGIRGKTKYMVKVGGSTDQTNLKSTTTGDLYLGIPEKELMQTAALRGIAYGKYLVERSPMFNFSDIRLNWAFRTYVNEGYTAKVKAFASYSDVTGSGITDGDISIRRQRWYGQYYLPNETHAVAKGFDVMDYADKYGVDYSEDFWLADGYIIVNFTIETIDENGKRRLSYINASNYLDYGHCSMWILEGSVRDKSSYKGPDFKFYAGDFIVYYANKRMTDDYSSGAIY